MSYPLLEGITESPERLKSLSESELKVLCAEIRTFLIQSISRTGGHLASNLGIVEISTALALEFDLFHDRILYDVGHQCYVHKLLTGRKAGFEHLRQFGGMSGFPKPSESNADPFVAGHASTALSLAAGFARARTLLHDDRYVVAVVGDAALTGGMSLEALNDIGRSEEPVIVLLNDNAMAISRSVGAMAEHLTLLRTKPGYFKLKTLVKSHTGKHFSGFLKRFKTRVRSLVLPTSILEEMGFTYLGPVNGHDIEKIRSLLSFAKLLARPVIIHCVTTKGCGSEYAEQNPCRYHGASAFDAASGVALKAPVRGFSAVFGDTLTSMARSDPKICAITAAMEDGTGLTPFARAWPERFFDVGIAEQHAVGLAAGLAKAGMTPVCAIYSTFLQRAYDQILHDVCLDPVHVVFAVDRAGIVPGDGETHQGIFDVMYLCGAPGMKVFAPASLAELDTALRRCIQQETGPCAVRYPRGTAGAYQARLSDDNEDCTVLREFSENRIDAVIITYGTMVNEAISAAKLLQEQGIAVCIVKLFVLSPLPDLSRFAGLPTVIAEDVVEAGCVGQRLFADFAARGLPVHGKLCNIGSRYLPCGTVPELRRLCGLDAAALADAVRKLLS